MAGLEALLFYYGEPIEVGKAAKLLSMKEEECTALAEKLAEKLDANADGGLTLMRNDGKIQLATKPSLAWVSKKLVEEEFREELTPAALETAAIIAYLEPVTRSVIDYIRGVNSTFILRSLLIRGLIMRSLQEGKRNIYEYSVSFNFLKHLGVASVEDLPEYRKYKNILQSFEKSEAAEETKAATEEMRMESEEETL